MTLTEIFLLILAVASIAGIGVLLARQKPADTSSAQQMLAALEANRQAVERLERLLREEAAVSRREAGEQATAARSEVLLAIGTGQQQVQETLVKLGRELRDSGADQARNQIVQVQEAGRFQREALDAFGKRVESLALSTEKRLEEIRGTLERKITELQTEHAQRMELMRATVDEKLQSTLERRLSESFALVGERLEQVHKGLGEMQAVASGVGDLRRMLTNVKTRGTWGEVQLGMLLEQVLTPAQFERNVAVVPGSLERVEFAIRLPGRDAADTPVWLPIDSKFPVEDYQRLVEAADAADPVQVEVHARALEARVVSQAKMIRDKYVQPPHTTDFALLYLPGEGIYAEVLRRPGLVESLQQNFRVVVAGPTTLAALLNSLCMGFRTLAIQERSAEVWKVLGAVKSEFGKFGDVLARVKLKLEQAGNEIDNTERRTRVLSRKLREVESVSDAEAQSLLGNIDEEPAGKADD